MEATPVYRRGEAEGKGIVTETAPGVFAVPSFAEEGKTYAVDLGALSCSCPRYRITGLCKKHVTAADAVAKARGGRCHTGAVEEELFRLCKAVFAKVGPRERPMESYRLLLEVLAYRHRTPAMERAAFSRHGRVLALAEAKLARGKRAA